MKKFEISGLEVWVGNHPKLGMLIFDGARQSGLPENQVRLFKVEKNESSTFLKEMVKLQIQELSDNEHEQAETAAKAYSNLILNRRVTHCFACKSSLDSVDFSLCPKCRWIRCSCGACGCKFSVSGAEA